ncbi:hypothetical protein HDU81_000636 [Chytriomyces hyalinus]|nr:hypothetical protein HDU81_000636 [Chytriomyces hyalinus]
MRCRKKENGVACNAECEQAESRTDANPGRLFWRCTKGHGWSGWVPAGQQQHQAQAGSSSSSNQRYTPYATPTTPVRAQQQPRAAPSSPTPAPRTTVPPPYSIVADRQTPPASQLPMGVFEDEEGEAGPLIGDQISAVLDPVSTLLGRVLNENKALKEANSVLKEANVALVEENEALRKKVRILAQAVDS